MIPQVMSTQNHVVLIQLPMPAVESRSISPLSSSASPFRDIRGIKLFRAISKKLARRSREELHSGEDADSRSSSTDSCSSTTAGRCPQRRKASGYRASSPHMSSSSSDAGSDVHRHSSSVENLKRIFQNLSIATRSQSCSNAKELKRNCAKKTAPKRILRTPVTYTYVKGLSGLPTQRVPRTQRAVYVNGSCACNVHYMAGLNR